LLGKPQYIAVQTTAKIRKTINEFTLGAHAPRLLYLAAEQRAEIDHFASYGNDHRNNFKLRQE
jgi:hypothetical protein